MEGGRSERIVERMPVRGWRGCARLKEDIEVMLAASEEDGEVERVRMGAWGRREEEGDRVEEKAEIKSGGRGGDSFLYDFVNFVCDA